MDEMVLGTLVLAVFALVMVFVNVLLSRILWRRDIHRIIAEEYETNPEPVQNPKKTEKPIKETKTERLRRELREAESEEKPEENVFKCKICGEEFDSKPKLRMHFGKHAED